MSMTRKLVFVCALLACSIPVIVHAQENSLLDEEFWKTATVQDVAKILDIGVDIKTRNEYGATPLHLAGAFSKTPEVISFLLDRGADIEWRDERGWTPLHFVARYSITSEVIALLLDRGANIKVRDEDGQTPLHQAARYSTTSEVIELLLDRGADAKAKDDKKQTPFDLLAQKGGHLKRSDVYWRLFSSEAKYNPLDSDAFWKVATVGDIAKIIDSGVDIKKYEIFGITPLHRAAGHSKTPEVIALLLERGADIEARVRGSIGGTPLHWAAEYSQTPEVVALLLDRGANAKAKDKKGNTPFDTAKKNGHLKRSDVYWRLNEAQYR